MYIKKYARQICRIYLPGINCRLQLEVMPAQEKQIAMFNSTDLSNYCREHGLYTKNVVHCRQTAPTGP